jgi:threonine dehydratase
VVASLEAGHPGARIVGANAEGAPSTLESLHAGRAVCRDRARTFADGIAVRNPVEASVRRALAAIAEGAVPGYRPATVLTGANPS